MLHFIWNYITIFFSCSFLKKILNTNKSWIYTIIHSIEYYFCPIIFCIRNLCFFFLMVVYLWTVTLNIRGEKDKDIPEENEDDSNFVGSAALLDIDMIFHHTLCCNIWFIRNILHKYIYRDAYPHAFFCFCLPGIHVPMRCNCLESK